jgi:RNA polymerase sigma-70 factor (ECF subfamily)
MTVMSLRPRDTSWDPSTLVERAASGDGDAWAQLVRAYTPRLYALAKSRLRDHHEAEEITQSVLVTVATKLSQGAYDETGRFEPWLFRIAMNRIRDEARRLSAHANPTDPNDLPPDHAHDETPDPDRFNDLRAAINTLSDDDRQIIELRHHAEMPFKAIADLLSTPMGTLLARHHRALKKLRAALESTPTNSGTKQ